MLQKAVELLKGFVVSQSQDEVRDRFASLKEQFRLLLHGDEKDLRFALSLVMAEADKCRSATPEPPAAIQTTIREKLLELVIQGNVHLLEKESRERGQCQRRLFARNRSLLCAIAAGQRQPDPLPDPEHAAQTMEELYEKGLVLVDEKGAHLSADGWMLLQEWDQEQKERHAALVQHWELIQAVAREHPTREALCARGHRERILAGLDTLYRTGLIEEVQPNSALRFTPDGLALLQDADYFLQGYQPRTSPLPYTALGALSKSPESTAATGRRTAAGFGDIRALDRALREQPEAVEMLRCLGQANFLEEPITKE